MKRREKGLGRWLMGALIAVFLANPARADDDKKTIEELRRRIEILEKQNRQMTKGAETRQTTDNAAVNPKTNNPRTPPPPRNDVPLMLPDPAQMPPPKDRIRRTSYQGPDVPRPLPQGAEGPSSTPQRIDDAPSAPDASQTPPAESEPKKEVEAAQVEKIVADYLKQQEEKKKQEEAQQKKEIEEQGFEVGKDLHMKVEWHHGLQAETADKAFRIHIGGRTQFDGAWVGTSDAVQYGPGGIGRADDAVNFRRARLTIDGTMYEVIDFTCEYDFLNTFNTERTGDPSVANVPVPTDLWAQITHLPWIGNLRMGNQKPPIGFEHLTSSRFLDFMERSLGFDAFIENQNNGFQPGVQIFNWNEEEDVTWALGVFKNTRNIFGWNPGDGEYEITGRVTYLPWYECDGRYLFHLGLGGSYRDLDDHQDRFRSRLLIRNGPAALHNIIAEARMLGANDVRLNPEMVLNWGPFTLQSEYTAVWVTDATAPITPPASRVNLGTAFYQAYYVEMLYFLTGEHRVYNRRYPAFGRVVPHENFFFVDGECGRLLGRGAWQVAARYSYLDLADKGINGGSQSNGATIHDVTFGINWFLNPNMKVQWNYSLAFREAIGDASNGTIHAFGTRLAFDF